ncbi:hypothetical protein ACHQM5_023944 [Ranunculus cassubicifolius]
MSKTSIDPRLLASLLSSFVSQLLLVLLFFFPNTPNLPPLFFNLLQSPPIAAATLLSPSSKKRKQPPPPSDDEEIVESSHSISPEIDPFTVCFKMKSSTFEWLTGLLEPLLECRDPVGASLNLPAEIRLGIGLFRLATGANYQETAKRFGVSGATSRFCAKQLCRVLCTNFRFWVAFPNLNELESVSNSFGFSNCCGVVGSIRFKVRTGDCKEETVLAQIVVDNSSKIMNIVAGFRGDKAVSRVLKDSTLYKDVEEGRLLNGPVIDVEGVSVPQFLIGDGSYPLHPWLMVPFVDPISGSNEEKFNTKLKKSGLSGRRTLASLRNWGILSKPIEEEYKTAVACIGACSILHNALLTREDLSALADEMEDYSGLDEFPQYCPDNSMEEEEALKKGSDIRNALATSIKVDCISDQPT